MYPNRILNVALTTVIWRYIDLDITSVAPGLQCGEKGIWFACRQAQISYPAHGNAACRQIEDRSFLFRHRNRCITSLVRRFVSRGTFLDIGGAMAMSRRDWHRPAFPAR
jgi:hypothetical protein